MDHRAASATGPPSRAAPNVSSCDGLDACCLQGPAKLWEEALLSMNSPGVAGTASGDEIAPKAKVNTATP